MNGASIEFTSGIFKKKKKEIQLSLVLKTALNCIFPSPSLDTLQEAKNIQ